MVTVKEHLEEMKTHFKELSDGYNRFSPQHEYYKGDVKLRKEKPAPKMEEKRRPAKANGQKPSVKNEKRENTQKRFNNSRGNDNGRENGRRAARSR